jgi:hypothetical protein
MVGLVAILMLVLGECMSLGSMQMVFVMAIDSKTLPVFTGFFLEMALGLCISTF